MIYHIWVIPRHIRVSWNEVDSIHHPFLRHSHRDMAGHSHDRRIQPGPLSLAVGRRRGFRWDSIRRHPIGGYHGKSLPLRHWLCGGGNIGSGLRFITGHQQRSLPPSQSCHTAAPSHSAGGVLELGANVLNMAVVGIGTILLYDILTAEVRYRTAVSIAIVILLFAALLQADRWISGHGGGLCQWHDRQPNI